jgi:hypothetical protein
VLDCGVRQAYEDLGRRLSALRADFAALGARAGDAASALAATLPPPPALLEQLSAARDAFAQVRNAVLREAGAVQFVLDVERLRTLRDLESVLTAISAAHDRRALAGAWEQARQQGLRVLDRVASLVHREERGFAPLAECQSRARELHRTLSGSAPKDLEHEARTLPGQLRPFTDLVALVEGWDQLDDDRCAALQDAITQAFGRPLALAALRGKLGEGEATAPAPPVRGSATTPPAQADRGLPFFGAPARSGAAAAPAAYSPTTAPAPAAPPASAPAVPTVSAPVVASPPGIAAYSGGEVITGGFTAVPPSAGPSPTPASGSVVFEIRLSGDRVSVETPQARKDREAMLERLAQQHARWWIAARDGWRQLHERGTAFSDAAREYIRRFPYLLSVPLQQSAAHESGRLAEGYALLLAHIEKQEEGFVREALTRLNPQFTARGTDDSFALAQELYLYIVAEGRLYKTYPDFAKEVITSVLPQPGLWVQGRLVESDAQTQIVTRPDTLGTKHEQTHTVTGWKERLGPHVFTTTAGPLTSRFFTVELAGGTLSDPPDVEIKLQENDAATDHAWLIPLPTSGKGGPLAPKRHRTGGTTLAALGQEFGGLWIGLFNADPSSERRYELSIALRRKPPAVGRPAASGAAAAAPSVFGRKR